MSFDRSGTETPTNAYYSGNQNQIVNPLDELRNEFARAYLVISDAIMGCCNVTNTTDTSSLEDNLSENMNDEVLSVLDDLQQSVETMFTSVDICPTIQQWVVCTP